MTKDYVIPRGYYTAPFTTANSSRTPRGTRWLSLSTHSTVGTPTSRSVRACSKLLGLTQQATYPDPAVIEGTTNLVFQSASVPQLSPVSVLMLACNMVSSRLSPNPQAFAQLPINAAWGSLCSYSTGTPTMLTAVPGVFSEFILRTGDQTGESYVCIA